MTSIEGRKITIPINLILIVLTFQVSPCIGQVNVKPVNDTTENSINNQTINSYQSTTFPQIHTNLNGMVREFVRTMHQDNNGNYWFGTNGDGIIRYDGKTLEKIIIAGIHPHIRVTGIVEDKAGYLYFGYDNGLIKYDGEKYTTYTEKDGLPDGEIWGLTFDKSGLLWVGSTAGMSLFDGKKFTPFSLPDLIVENPEHMLSDKLVFNIMEDKSGTMWLVTDGNGIFKYNNGEFTHLTTKNGLTDNNAGDVLEDRQGNIWIGTFYGGVSKYDGKTYTNFTKDGIIKGVETGGFLEDRNGNIWFSAENVGVYKYDGTNFTLYTTENGLTSNVVLRIYEDNKGQLWFGTWQGLCIFDGEKFVNAKDKEPWTN